MSLVFAALQGVIWKEIRLFHVRVRDEGVHRPDEAGTGHLNRYCRLGVALVALRDHVYGVLPTARVLEAKPAAFHRGAAGDTICSCVYKDYARINGMIASRVHHDNLELIPLGHFAL